MATEQVPTSDAKADKRSTEETQLMLMPSPPGWCEENTLKVAEVTPAVQAFEEKYVTVVTIYPGGSDDQESACSAETGFSPWVGEMPRSRE